MKSLARAYVWWPKLDQELKQRVRTCNACQQMRPQTPVAMHPWEWPKKPWIRLHIDYAGPINGKMYLVLIDAYSKWLEVKMVSAATSQNTIEQLRSTFACHGLPEIIVTDNGTAFTSQEFQDFVKFNGIRHVRIAPYLMGKQREQSRYSKKDLRKVRQVL